MTLAEARPLLGDRWTNELPVEQLQVVNIP
jgi:hypothetical protein